MQDLFGFWKKKFNLFSKPSEFSEPVPPIKSHHRELSETTGPICSLCAVQWDGLYFVVHHGNHHTKVSQSNQSDGWLQEVLIIL